MGKRLPCVPRTCEAAVVVVAAVAAVASASPSWSPGPRERIDMRSRSGLAMAFDEARGNIVMYGGGSPAGSTATYVLDGSGWREAAPSPAGLGIRYDHGMAYDAARQRVVLFGGAGTNDTWEYDGSSWSAGGSAPAALTPRRSMGFAYHAGLQRVVLFGGADGGLRDDTWLYDGAAWSPGPAAPAAMLPRAATAMAYHAALGRLVLFGGETGSSPPPDSWSNDTWELASSAWTPGPAAPIGLHVRAYHSMAYDGRRGRIVLSHGIFDETWEYDGAWMAGAPPPSGMATRLGHGCAYDPLRGVVIVFGGRYWPQPPLTLDDTWAYDGAGWRPIPDPDAGMRDRFSHAAAYDEARDRVVVFGGISQEGTIDRDVFDDTWEYDGIDWQPGATAPAGMPGRHGHAMAFDPSLGRVVLFGGLDDPGRALDDTWELGPAGWTAGAPAPPGLAARGRHAMAHDRLRGRTVLFGGSNTAGPRDDTWEYDAGGWSAGPVAPAALSPRASHAMAYDEARARTVLFGGALAGGAELDDTWLFDGLAWSPGPAAPPGLLAREGAVLAYRPGLSRTVLFGGSMGTTLLDDTWELATPGWLQGAQTPPGLWPRTTAAMTDSAATGGLVLVGGESPTYNSRGDAWIYACLTLAPPDLPAAAEGALYTATVVATGGAPPYTYTMPSGALPPGLALSSAGVISGIPAAAGDFPLLVHAADATGCTGSRAYELRVACDGPSPSISPAALPGGTVGVPYSQMLVGSGGAPPYAFALDSGLLPWGLSLDTGGLIDGTPLGASTTSFTIGVVDAAGCRGTRTYTIVVDCPRITIDPPTFPDGKEGQSYGVNLSASGGVAPYWFELLYGSIPAGLTFSTYGRLSGIPASSGSFQLTVRARDDDACTGTATYTFVIHPRDDVVAGRGLGAPNPNRLRVHDASGAYTSVEVVAYAAGQWGVNVAAGAIDADLPDEILTGPGPGPTLGPQVRAFRRDGSPVAKVNLFAYGTLRHGVNVAAGTVDGDAYEEILTGAGPGEVFGPHVRGFDHDGGAVAPIPGLSFFAYATLKYGVNVAAGDVDGDDAGEILTGAGPNPVFAPHVRGFEFGASVTPMPTLSFWAFATAEHGVNLAAADADGDGDDAELACTPGPGPTLPSRVLGFEHEATVTALPGFDVVAFPTLYGGRVGFAQLQGTRATELLAGGGRDPSAPSTVAPYRYASGALALLPTGFTPFPGGYGVDLAGAALGY